MSPSRWLRALRWAAVPTLVKDLGPILGLVSFAGFVVLVVLYVMRSMEIRRLRRAAPFLAEGNGRPQEPEKGSAGTAQRPRG